MSKSYIDLQCICFLNATFVCLIEDEAMNIFKRDETYIMRAVNYKEGKAEIRDGHSSSHKRASHPSIPYGYGYP